MTETRAHVQRTGTVPPLTNPKISPTPKPRHMSRPTNQNLPVYTALIAIGTSLNTLGIVFQSLGWARYVLMGAGILMMLVGVVQVVAPHVVADDRAG